MKLKLSCGLFSLFLIVFAGYGCMQATDESETIKMKLADVNKYKYFLDKGNEAIGNKMKEKDLVIIEPITMQVKYITEAQDSGTLVYGYINSMEADQWNEDLYAKFEEEDFYKDDKGNRMYFEQWNSYMMDMSSPHYQQVLVEEIEKQVVFNGLDGVFLDTVGNIDAYLPKAEQEKQNIAMEQFMKEVKSQFKGLSIAQNWGFNTLTHFTAPYIDFVMWEDFSYDVVGEDQWALDKMEELKKLRSEFGIQVMTVGFTDDHRSKQLAHENKFKYVFNEAGSYYNEW